MSVILVSERTGRYIELREDGYWQTTPDRARAVVLDESEVTTFCEDGGINTEVFKPHTADGSAAIATLQADRR